MKWEQLESRSLRLNDTTRFRLARPEDKEFLHEMGKLSGGVRTQLPVDEREYAVALKAALRQRGGYFKKIVEVHNNSVDSGKYPHPMIPAIIASSFDLIAVQGKRRVGAMSVGASHSLVAGMLGRVDDHQLLSLVIGLPKLISLAVIPEVKGEGIGADLLSVLAGLLTRMGCVGIYGECDDARKLVKFYEQHKFTVLPKKTPLNTWPVAGRHVVQSSPLLRKTSHETQGPFIMPDKEQRIMFRLSDSESETASRMASLNEVPVEVEAEETEIESSRPNWVTRARNWLGRWF